MEQSTIHIDEGKYVIDVQTLQKEKDEPSAMANYLSQSAIVTNQDGSLTLTVMIEGHETITGFQVENEAGELKEAAEIQVNEETNRRFEMFELDSLTSILYVRVQYEVDHDGRIFKGDEALRLSLDKESLEKIA
jgi:heme-binding NEAT domain protein